MVPVAHQRARQEFYYNVRVHLLSQMAKSHNVTSFGACLYRGPGGLKCAIGGQISDADYSPVFENQQAAKILPFFEKEWGLSSTASYPEDESDCSFVNKLQGVHDNNHPWEWDVSLREFAAKYNLYPC